VLFFFGRLVAMAKLVLGQTAGATSAKKVVRRR